MPEDNRLKFRSDDKWLSSMNIWRASIEDWRRAVGRWQGRSASNNNDIKITQEIHKKRLDKMGEILTRDAKRLESEIKDERAQRQLLAADLQRLEQLSVDMAGRMKWILIAGAVAVPAAVIFILYAR